MKKLKADIIASFKNKKINVFVLFLLSAFVILIFTKLSKEYTKTIPFEIAKINVPQENVILNDTTSLNITLKTYGFKWLKYYFSKPKITIDFSKDVINKEGEFVWNKSKSYLNNTQFSKEVEILNITPDPLIFKYGNNKVKKVPVVLNGNVTFYPGFDMSDKLVSEPDSIVVVGPDELVSKITYLETEAFTLNEVRSDIQSTVKLKLPDKTPDLKFSTDYVTVKGKVEKFTEGTLTIPVHVINSPDNVKIKYFPKVINVSYYVSLSNFNAISAKDFKVVCDFSKINEGQSFLIPELVKQPETVKNTRLGLQRIEFIITK
jgi:hypothetical protein